jgi:hypothetical protein
MHPFLKEIKERCGAIGCIKRRENQLLPYCAQCFAALPPQLQELVFEHSLLSPSIVDKPLDWPHRMVTHDTLIFLRNNRYTKTRSRTKESHTAAPGYSG